MKSINYTWDKTSNETIELAFNKKRADDRKNWLYSYDKQDIIETVSSNAMTNISYSDFINKDLIHFSNYNVERSIPHICDGLKLSLRKILYCCFKRDIYIKKSKWHNWLDMSANTVDIITVKQVCKTRSLGWHKRL